MEDQTVVAHFFRKTKNLLCGIEWKTTVAHGHPPFLACKTEGEGQIYTTLLVRLCDLVAPLAFILFSAQV